MAFDCFNLGSLVSTDPLLLKNDFFDNLPLAKGLLWLLSNHIPSFLHKISFP